MILRLAIFFMILLCGCKSGLIDCPEVRGPKAKRTMINTKNLRAEDLYVSSSTRKMDKDYARSYERLREQRSDLKNPQSIEEWDCPRPGKQKNSKIVKGNVKRMERKMQADMEERMERDSLNFVPVISNKNN
jgi:hypothetical protein